MRPSLGVGDTERIGLDEAGLTEHAEGEACRHIDLEELHRFWPRLWISRSVTVTRA